MKIGKRPYQQRAVKNLRKKLKSDNKVLAVAPTAAGKTVIASLLVKASPEYKKVLWIAHRHELIDQAYNSLVGMGLSVGVFMAQDEKLHGGDRVDKKARVQVASVQTIARRGAPKGVDLIIFDEAHRVASDSYQNIAKSRPRAKVLGLTATPCRSDKKGLGDFFKVLYNVAQYSDLQKQKYIAKPITWSTPTDIEKLVRVGLKGARTSKGDFSKAAMAKAVDKEFLVGRVVEESIRLAANKPKVVFACNVDHSKRLVSEFLRNGVPAMHLDATTPAEDRANCIKELSSGDIEVICNVNILTEGWDLPKLFAVIIARPTKSKGLFIQMAGRGQRRYKNSRPIVIDHGNNVARLDIIPGDDIEWGLEEGIEESDKGTEPRVRACEECDAVLERGSLICEQCGHEHEPINTPAQDREELAAELEQITRKKLDTIRARVEKFAKGKNVPKGWADKVVAELAGQ